MNKLTMNCNRFRELFPFLTNKSKGGINRTKKRFTHEGMKKKFLKHEQEIAHALIKIGFKVFAKYNNNGREYQMIDVRGYTANMQPLYSVDWFTIRKWMSAWQ